MKNIIALIIIVILVASCQDPSYSGDYFIRNNSSHTIDIYLYNKGKLREPIILDIGGYNKEHRSDRSGVVPPPVFYADSLQVVFNDTVSITHFRVANQDISRNMFYSESWSGGQLNDYDYQYDYIFTDEDYIEALEKE